MTPQPNRQQGFTLVELVMVIVILGIVGAMVAVFMRAPVDAYFDTARRAALTDVADTTLRRMARDIQRALPNSVRGGGACLEFIPTRTGGRYRVQDIAAGDGSALNFGGPDNRFNMLGDHTLLPAQQQIQVGDRIVVYNLGIPGASAYANNNWSAVTGVVPGAGAAVNETVISMNAFQFPLASPNHRFHVIPAGGVDGESVVSYVCAGGQLRRNTNYGYANSCPAPGPATPVMANGVAGCNFVINGADLQRNALVQITLTLTDAAVNETVTLYHEVHVNNTP